MFDELFDEEYNILLEENQKLYEENERLKAENKKLCNDYYSVVDRLADITEAYKRLKELKNVNN